MEDRKQFTFYESFARALSRIRKKTDRADAYDAIVNYALYGIEPNMESLSDAAAIAFDLIRPTLDASRKKANSGKSGGKRKQAESKQEANGKQTASEKEKEKEKENECYTPLPPAASVGKSGVRVDAYFSSLLSEYPQHKIGNKSKAWNAFRANVRSDADGNLALENLRLWKQSDRWTKEEGRYIPRLDNWLSRGEWKTPPPRMTTPKGASGELGEAELEAIRRVLAEPVDEGGSYGKSQITRDAT